ncbi:amidase [Cutaneotrichosporon oleaginosum]|uniref:Amidase n=1 Tax=Cutaneotrichosporon oleaginosum TaxID=879819 RepID=A0A0J1AYL1_9TREE|nr:amidase [Cutaneotrichosporon oleaginosum]KLT40394.1 amidase [Cutaneotrichosporon oleaginosum]
MTRSLTQKRIDAVLAKRDAGIPPEWRPSRGAPSLLDAKERAIIALSATALRDELAAGRLTAVAVTTAYCKATNCLIELYADDALAAARRLDAEFARTARPVGALHGVPVSLADDVCVRGHDAAAGFLSLVDKPAAEDAHAVAIMRDAGAIFFCRASSPGYFGTTTNPANAALTSGSGEGALLGMRASPLGVGTDVGGGVRAPAAATGVYAFKPTSGRLPSVGASVIHPAGWHGMPRTPGVLARAAPDLELYMALMCGSTPWRRDPALSVQPWVPAQRRKFRVGILRDDGVVAPVEAVERALEIAANRLRRTCDVRPFEPFHSARAWDLVRRLYWPDGGARVMDALADSGEEVRPLTRWIIEQSGHAGRSMGAEELFALCAARDEFRARLAAHWEAAGVDVVLMPVGPTPAPKHGTAKYWNYTSYWNLVDYPAGVFPTGLVCDKEDTHDPYCFPRNSVEKEIWDSYDPEAQAGAPLCLQVVGQRGYDEDTLAALQEIAAAVQA